MAKSTVTEQDVSAGIASLGGLGGLTKAANTTRRDSPFGAGFAKKPSSALVAPEAIEPAQQTGAPQVTAAATGVSAALPIDTSPPQGTAGAEASEIKIQPSQATTKPQSTVVGQGRLRAPASAMSSIPKTQLYTERVTMLMDSATRDELNRVAHALQRKKSDSRERITANTLMRVAVKLFLEDLRPSDGDTPLTESELYQLTKAKIRRRG